MSFPIAFPLNDAQKYFHLNFMQDVGSEGDYIKISGILASGESNYYDKQQQPIYVLHIGYDFQMSIPMGQFPLNNLTRDLRYFPPAQFPYNTELLEPYGYYFPIHVSNGIDSTFFSINDFSIFAPYVHYMPKISSSSSFNSGNGATSENPNYFPDLSDNSNIDVGTDGLAFLINTSFIANLAIFAYNNTASGVVSSGISV